MKLLIVRHGDPDYSIDSLTEKGWREADFLADRLVRMPATAYYCSPLGRAKDTAKATLSRLGRTAEECPWLREFSVRALRPDAPDTYHVCWDWLPEDWTKEPRFFHQTDWAEHPVMLEGKAREEYEWVITNLDRLLSNHGYRREGRLYRVERGNNDTLVFFCHFGVECVLLSHLLNIPPMLLWHGTIALPTSVTTLVTEERREGSAYFRMNGFGDVSHLYAAGEEPSPSGRFIERWGNPGERID